MRILTDHNIGNDLVESLRAAGADVVRAQDLGLATASDEVVLARAVAEERVVVTLVSDFGALVVLRGAGSGVVLIRPAESAFVATAAVVAAVLRLETEPPPFIAIVGLHRGMVRTRVRSPV